MTPRVMVTLVMLMVRVPQVTHRGSVSPVMPMGRVLQVMLQLTVRLVMLMVMQMLVLAVGPPMGGRWPVVGVGPHHSWWRALEALLPGLPAFPGSVCRLQCWGGSPPIMAEGVAGDVDVGGAVGDAMVSLVMTLVRGL